MRIGLLFIFLLLSCSKKAEVKESIRLAVKDIAGQEIFIRVFKEESQLELWSSPTGDNKFKLFKVYDICAWSGSLGPKLKEGDGQSPEGFYTVEKSQLKPDSTYHRAFNIGFPNEFDKANGRTGSFIMVHGNCVSIGCYAMTDPIIEEIYYLVESALNNGQKQFHIHIFPFRMTDENMNKHKSNKWFSFWQNLEEGYELFENSYIPPTIYVKNKRYSF